MAPKTRVEDCREDETILLEAGSPRFSALSEFLPLSLENDGLGTMTEAREDDDFFRLSERAGSGRSFRCSALLDVGCGL